MKKGRIDLISKLGEGEDLLMGENGGLVEHALEVQAHSKCVICILIHIKRSKKYEYRRILHFDFTLGLLAAVVGVDNEAALLAELVGELLCAFLALVR